MYRIVKKSKLINSGSFLNQNEWVVEISGQFKYHIGQSVKRFFHHLSIQFIAHESLLSYSHNQHTHTAYSTHIDTHISCHCQIHNLQLVFATLNGKIDSIK